MLVRESPKAKVSPDKNAANWPPKSPYEALLSSPSGRKRWQDHSTSRSRPRTPSPSPKRAIQTNQRSPYALESRLEAAFESDHAEEDQEDGEDEDEETLRLKLAAIEARLKLKKLQQAKAKGAADSTLRSPRRAETTHASPSRKRLRLDNDVQVPVSPVRLRQVTDSAINTSPARVILGIDKGLRAQDVSLKRPRPMTNPSGGSTTQNPVPRVKSFTERLAESRTNEIEQNKKQERIQQARGRGFGLSDLAKDTAVSTPRHATTSQSARQPTLLASARKNVAAAASSTKPSTSSAASSTAIAANTPTAPTVPTSSKARNSQDKDPNLEPFSGIHLSKRLIPEAALSSALSDKEFYPLPRLLKEVKSPSYEPPDCENDYVVFGIIAAKSTPHDTKNPQRSTNMPTSAETNKFMVLTLTDLHWTVDLFLFGASFTQHWRLPVGAVIAVLSPGIMPPRPHAKDSGRFSLKLSAAADDEILELGTAQHLGFCRSARADGRPCDAWLDARRTEHCAFHVNLAVGRARAARMEVNTLNRDARSKPRSGPASRANTNTGSVAGEVFFMGPAAPRLLDAEDRADPELMRKRLHAKEKERELGRRLGRLGNGAGAAYLRAADGAAEAWQGELRGAERPADDAVVDAVALGLVGRAEDVRLSPVKGRRRGLAQHGAAGATEQRGWSGAFKRGLLLEGEKRPAVLEKGQGRLDFGAGGGGPASSSSSAVNAARPRSLSPSKKRARFMLDDKGLREPGRESLGDAVHALADDDDDDDLDII